MMDNYNIALILSMAGVDDWDDLVTDPETVEELRAYLAAATDAKRDGIEPVVE